MPILDEIKHMASIVVSVPEDLHLGKLTVILEQKAASEKAALEREAAALKGAASPALEAAWAELKAKLEPILAHIPGLGALAAAHGAVDDIATKVGNVAGDALHAVQSAIEPAQATATTDAVPLISVL